jgi:D-glycero-D-manno-heptose 1,7-bisphosphate phosphatase
MSVPVEGAITRAIFFDRDGTLNWPAAPGEYIRDPDDLRLLPGAAAAVRQVKAVGYMAILITNQRWLSEPDADPSVYALIERKLSCLLAAEDVRLDASYTCPHAAGSCDCRKPLPGLLLRAAEDFGLSLADSYFVGDSVTDAEAGAAAGVRTILLVPEHASNASRRATYVVRDIEQAAEVVLRRSGRAGRGSRPDLVSVTGVD